MADVIILFDGYSTRYSKNEMTGNCSCVLIKGQHSIIVDTMTPWDSEKILWSLTNNNIRPGDINYVVSTHGHSDHVGNNNLFLKAKHIVGFNISYKDTYFQHPFDKGEDFIINECVRIIPTPGHTLSDVTVFVYGKQGKIAITGDLFEKVEDIANPNIWLEAGSEDPVQQMTHRSKIANMADYIVPGHGPGFKVTDVMREALWKQSPEGK